MNRPVFRPAPLALAIALAIGCPSLRAQSASALPNAPVPINIAAQPLGQALNDWARQTRIELIVPPVLVAGKTAPAVAGSLTPRQALDRLLAGSGLFAAPEADAIVVKAAPGAGAEAVLQPVTVTAAAQPSPQRDGRAADGYRARAVSSVGVLDSMNLRDVPFSISVMPRELIENIQAQSPDDIYKINPSTRTIVAQGTGWSPVVGIRGFSTYDTAEDGLRRPYNHAAVLEDKERVEVLNGLSGFLYGAAAPAGIVNYVYKRPTRERLSSVTVGNYGGGQYYVHGDFGGRLDEAGHAGYRLNVVRQDGKTAIDDQKIDRMLVSGAVDWSLTDKLLLELTAVYNNYKTQSPLAYWNYGIPHGRAPDASKNWSQPWIRDEFDNTKLMGRLTYQLNDQVTLRGAYSRSLVDRPVQDHTMNSVSAAGYEQIAIHSGRTKNNFDAAQALVDVKFGTGTLAHTVTAGYFMYSSKDWGTTYNPNTGWSGPYSLSTPTRLQEPVFPRDASSPYVASKASNKNFVIGDNIKFSERWSALLGITRSQITTQDFDPTGLKLQSDYDKSRNSPALSLLFKPVPWLTTYASYIEGLEMGGRAPDTASNSGSVMPPMVSKQKEVGIKADVRGMLLTAAVFDIEKAYEYTDANNIYTQSGRQNHKGVEFTATGKLTRRLTLLGGATLLDAAINGGDYSGKAPVNVAKIVAKLYAEYALAVPGLTATGGIFHTGRQWADEDNTDRLPASTTVDLGVRYTTQASGRPLTLRLSVSNVANKNYWANSHYVGAPRSVAFSAQYQF